jgi:hypothetical protein
MRVYFASEEKVMCGEMVVESCRKGLIKFLSSLPIGCGCRRQLTSSA